MKTKKGVLMGQIFYSLPAALEVFGKLSDEIKKRKVLVQVGDAWMIVGKSQLKAIQE